MDNGTIDAAFGIGTQVKISGLKSKPELNGTVGTVQSTLEENRYTIRCSFDGMQRRIRPVNLKLHFAPELEVGVMNETRCINESKSGGNTKTNTFLLFIALSLS